MRCHYHGPVTICWPLSGPHDDPRDHDDQPAAVPRDGPLSWPRHDDPSLPHSIDVQDSRVLDTQGDLIPQTQDRSGSATSFIPKSNTRRNGQKRLNCIKVKGINMNEKFVRCTNSWFTKKHRKYPESSSLLANLIFSNWFILLIWSEGSTLPWCHEARRNGMYGIWNLPC